MLQNLLLLDLGQQQCDLLGFKHVMMCTEDLIGALLLFLPLVSFCTSVMAKKRDDYLGLCLQRREIINAFHTVSSDPCSRDLPLGYV